MEVFTNLSREEVALACNRFRGRLEKVIGANGDFIEYIFSQLLNKHCHKKLRFYLVSKYVFMRERERKLKKATNSGRTLYIANWEVKLRGKTWRKFL